MKIYEGEHFFISMEEWSVALEFIVNSNKKSIIDLTKDEIEEMSHIEDILKKSLRNVFGKSPFFIACTTNHLSKYNESELLHYHFVVPIEKEELDMILGNKKNMFIKIKEKINKNSKIEDIINSTDRDKIFNLVKDEFLKLNV